MHIFPIRNDRDHARAFRHMETLRGARAGSPAAKEVEVLVPLVHAYEARHHRILPPGPIEAITFRTEQEGLTRAVAAQLVRQA